LPRRISEDHKDFRDIFAGKIRKELKKFIKNGSIFRLRGDGKKIKITIPKIELPHIVYGETDGGIGRGKGDPGNVIGKDDDEGDGGQAGEDAQEGILISINMEDVWKFLKEELQLPDLKQKPNQTYEDIRIKYNDISKTGPESLRHNRRTMLQALKRMCASGEINKLHTIPGFSVPVKLITPINSDRRYRQYKEIKVPSSNAVIFFARDGSGSMDDTKCDIVSDMAWWIDLWVRRFYKRVESVYVWHDVQAEEVDQNKFYKYRYGGGTVCSSALKFILKQFENRFPPEKWNIYVVYFTDGENFEEDNNVFNKLIADKMSPNIVNMVGIAQIMCWNYGESLRKSVDQFGHAKNVRTTSIGAETEIKIGYSGHNVPELSEDERNEQIKSSIIDLLGNPQARKKQQSDIKTAS
jgi:uncharacterized sporulation protein YeaH/YhbH (DUF444 family)